MSFKKNKRNQNKYIYKKKEYKMYDAIFYIIYLIINCCYIDSSFGSSVSFLLRNNVIMFFFSMIPQLFRHYQYIHTFTVILFLIEFKLTRMRWTCVISISHHMWNHTKPYKVTRGKKRIFTVLHGLNFILFFSQIIWSTNKNENNNYL